MIKASSVGVGILSLAGLAFAGAVARDALNSKAPVPFPTGVAPPARAAAPKAQPGASTPLPPRMGRGAGSSVGSMLKALRAIRAKRQGGGDVQSSMEDIPAVLHQISLVPQVDKKNTQITGWIVTVPTQSKCPEGMPAIG